MKLKVLWIVLMLSFSSYAQKQKIKDSLKPYVNYLKTNKFLSAKDYILNKFETKDIVIISERHHADILQYELILSVIKDEKFEGNIYTEVGCANNYKRINNFLLNSSLDDKAKEQTLLALFRDLDYDVLWDKYNYYYLLSEVFEINKTREKDSKILIYPLDVVFKWDDLKSHSQYKMFDDLLSNNTLDRDYLMGKHFHLFYKSAKNKNPKKRKALVIENTYHGYIRIPKFLPYPTKPGVYSTGEYIYKTYPKITTNIYINYLRSGNNFEKLAANGLYDAAFDYTGVDNVGFDLKRTPFGNTKFDLYNFGGSSYETVNFDYIFDGMVFYYPLSEMKLVWNIPNIYPKEFEEQFYKRLSLTEGKSVEVMKKDKEAIKWLKEINVKQIEKLNKAKLLKIKEQINQWYVE